MDQGLRDLRHFPSVLHMTNEDMPRVLISYSSELARTKLKSVWLFDD